MTKINGKIYFIKEGSVFEKSFQLENDEIITKTDELSDVAKKKASEGTSVILTYDNFALGKNEIIPSDEKRTQIFISKDINNDDYLFFNNYVNENATNRFYITNYVVRNDHEDYDYYNESENMIHKLDGHTEEEINEINSKRKASNILDLFLRKKLDKLTIDEKVMYDNYEYFDINNILNKSTRLSNYLNNGDAGVITIFDDRIYKTTVTKMQHEGENKIHKKWYKDETSLESDNYISLQLMNDAIVSYIPSNINDYQKEEMIKLSYEIDKLKENNTNLRVGFIVVDNQTNRDFLDFKEDLSGSDIREYIGSKKR